MNDAEAFFSGLWLEENVSDTLRVIRVPSQVVGHQQVGYLWGDIASRPFLNSVERAGLIHLRVPEVSEGGGLFRAGRGRLFYILKQLRGEGLYRW